MGKGYNNYMCKKPFHPGSKANIKRAWMAEQKTESEKRKQEELKVQYEKEQDLYNNRALISSESKDKLELNFMYEAPPGAKRERQKEDDEPEYKFEWQRKYNAPREDYAKGNEDIKDQPFGIPVRNVRCIKCHKWGHINTDKECPLYNQASTSSMPTTSMDPMELMRQMKEDGFGLKEHVLGHQLNPAAANQQFIPSDESDPEMDFLKSLSTAEKKKLLKKLKKLSKKQEKSGNYKKKKSKKSKKSKARDSSSSDSEDAKKVKKKKKSKKSSSSSESESSSSDESSKKRKKKKNKHSDSKGESSKSEKVKSLKSKEAPNQVELDSISEKNHEHHSSKDKFNKGNSEKEKKDNKFEMDSSKPHSAHLKLKIEECEEVPLKQKKCDLSGAKHLKDYADKSKQDRSYHSTSSSEEELHTMQSQKTESKQSECRDPKKRTLERSESEDSCDNDKRKKSKSDHPDGFSHLCPQALIQANYLKPEVEYKGGIHDKFRHLNRDKRSPSVKQKYNK